MAGSYLTPMLLLTGVSAGNEFYNTGNPATAVKPLLMGGIATGILAVVSNAPGAEPVTGALAWLAFIALMISPVQHPSPLQNLQKIVGSG